MEFNGPLHSLPALTLGEEYAVSIIYKAGGAGLDAITKRKILILT
jgi:hypothetical protein